MRKAFLAFGMLCVALISSTRGAEWPQYRGPNQDGVSTEAVNLIWPSGGPKVLWKVPTNMGLSSFAIGGGKAFTLVARPVGGAPREVCIALDAATGKELWMADLAVAKYQNGDEGTADNKGGTGPRSTPTYNGGMVYTLTPDLELFALDAATGKTAWHKDLVKENGAKNIQWKSAAAPVIDGDLLFVAGGGTGQSLLGINKKTGQVVWKTLSEKFTQAMPVVATILGERQVIFFTQSGLVSVSPADGKLLWRFAFPFKTANASAPVVGGDMVFCAEGYGAAGGGGCKLTKEGGAFVAAALPWNHNPAAATLWSPPVYKDGYLYGMFNSKDYGKGPLKCIEMATGKVMWQQAGFGTGNVIVVNDKLLALTDAGVLVTIQASPAAYKELARFKAVSGKCWSTPAISDGRVFVRSTVEGVCLDVR